MDQGTPLPPPPGEAPVAATEQVSPRSRWRKPAAIVAIVAVVLGGGVATAAFLLSSRETGDLLARVPADAHMVIVANLDPSASQKANLFRMTSEFPGLGGEQDLADNLQPLLDEVLAEVQVDQQDLRWVGGQAVLTIQVPELGEPVLTVLLASDNDSEASDLFVRLEEDVVASGETWTETTYSGVTIGGSGEVFASVWDGAAVISNRRAGIEAVIDTADGEKESLAASPLYQETMAGLPADRLGSFFFNARELFDRFEQQMGMLDLGAPLDFGPTEAMAVSLSAEPDGLALDAVVVNDTASMSPEEIEGLDTPDHANPLTALIPQDALGVAIYQHMDVQLRNSLDAMAATDPELARQLEAAGITDERGVLSLLSGDLAFEVSPDATLPVGGAVLIGVTEPEVARAIMEEALRLIPPSGTSGPVMGGASPKGVVWSTDRYRGVDVTFASRGTDLPFAFGVVGDVAVVASSPDQVRKIVDVSLDGGGLAEDPAFEEAFAEVPSSDSQFLVDVQAILATVRRSLDPQAREAFERDVAPYLEPITQIVMGQEGDAEMARSRLFIRIP